MAAPKTKPAKIERRTLSIMEAGDILGLRRFAMDGAIKRGEIQVLRFGRKIVVPIAEVERLLGAPIRLS